MKKFTAILIAITLFFFSFHVYAEDPTELSFGAAGIGRISPMNKGDKAPFNGVLLDAEAAAKIIVNQKEAENKCKIEIEKEVGIAEAKLLLDLENIKASRDALQKELDVRVKLKNEHIEFLENQAVKNSKKASNGKWWLIGGIAIGIALTIGGAFVIREVRGNQPIVITSGN